jgi:peptidylprolyl isomerase
MRTTESGLKYSDERVGVGSEPKRGQTCVVEYSSWLWENGRKGKSIDNSRARGKPFRYIVGGDDRVMKGVQEGIASMRPGGRRLLLIPPSLGRGKRGAGRGIIPPNATLLYDIELTAIEKK